MTYLTKILPPTTCLLGGRSGTRISSVEICDLAPQREVRGVVFRYHDQYLILIDRKHNSCVIRMLWTTLHEIAHVIKNHVDGYGMMTFRECLFAERTADLWAFQEIGMFKNDGSIEEDSIYCLPCCQYGYLKCPKMDTS